MIPAINFDFWNQSRYLLNAPCISACARMHRFEFKVVKYFFLSLYSLCFPFFQLGVSWLIYKTFIDVFTGPKLVYVMVSLFMLFRYIFSFTLLVPPFLFCLFLPLLRDMFLFNVWVIIAFMTFHTCRGCSGSFRRKA